MRILFLSINKMMNKEDDNSPVTRGEFKAAMVKIDERFTAQDERFSSHDKKFVSIDSRFDSIDRRFDVLEGRFDVLEGRFDVLEGRFDTFEHRFRVSMRIINERFDSIEERMYTKEDHARDMVWMDKAMEEIMDAREERILYTKQLLRMDDRVADHEKRIRVLER